MKKIILLNIHFIWHLCLRPMLTFNLKKMSEHNVNSVTFWGKAKKHFCSCGFGYKFLSKEEKELYEKYNKSPVSYKK